MLVQRRRKHPHLEHVYLVIDDFFTVSFSRFTPSRILTPARGKRIPNTQCQEGVSHHVGRLLTSLQQKYRAIWRIATIVSQYRDMGPL